MDGRIFKDIGALAGLVLALAIVFGIDRGRKAEETPTVTVTEPPGESSPPRPEPKPLRLGVTPSEFEDVAMLLRQMGKPYNHFQSLTPDDLLSGEKLRQLDVVFFTCGYLPEPWSGEVLGSGDRGGVRVRIRPEIQERLKRSLREFVNEGGTLYASDKRYPLISVAFPEMSSSSLHFRGPKGEITAEITDSGLRDALGPTVNLRFDLDDWETAAFRGTTVVEMMRGRFHARDGLNRGSVEAPLLVKFPHGKGTVIFTSFHNEKQNSATEEKLLKYLVFSAELAKTESQVRSKLVQGGFKPQKSNILGMAKGNPETRLVYQCPGKGTLKFALSFENRGASLELKVTDPEGKSTTKKGNETFELDIADAKPGSYEYVIRAENLPGDEFPFNLQIAHKEP